MWVVSFRYCPCLPAGPRVSQVPWPPKIAAPAGESLAKQSCRDRFLIHTVFGERDSAMPLRSLKVLSYADDPSNPITSVLKKRHRARRVGSSVRSTLAEDPGKSLSAQMVAHTLCNSSPSSVPCIHAGKTLRCIK